MKTDHREKAQWIPGSWVPRKCYREWQREEQCNLRVGHLDSQVLPFKSSGGGDFY